MREHHTGVPADTVAGIAADKQAADKQAADKQVAAQERGPVPGYRQVPEREQVPVQVRVRVVPP